MTSLDKAKKFGDANVPKGRKSKLDKHFEAIKYLRDEGFNINQILEFLEKELKLKVGYTTLQYFIKSRIEDKKKIEETQIKTTPIETKKDKVKSRNYIVQNQNRKNRIDLKKYEED